ncbi:MAG TPA: Hpt domain-containing protein, partial [Holophaga sp.]|nr:Hpt domain-containing protein [Holophaga sp.]
GMNDYLAKPIDPDEMFRVLARWMPDVASTSATPPVLEAAPPEAGPAEDGIPCNVPGLDTELGLKRLRGKRALYLDLLRKFAEGQGSTAGEIRQCLAGGDRTTAERMAHTLKGIAGNLGATGIQGEAAAVEHGLRDGHAVEPQLEKLAQSLTELTRRLRRALPAPDHHEVVDAGQAAAVVERLRRLLVDNDPEAEEVMEEHLELLHLLMPGQGDAFVRCVRAFDFDKALTLLGAMEVRP